MSYAQLCRPPNIENFYTKRCNIITGKCKKVLRNRAWSNADRRFNKCLRTSEWGRPRINFYGKTCWTKTKGKDKGKEFCMELGTGDAASQPSFNPNMSGSTTGSVASQLGLGQDAAGNFKLNQQHMIIGAAVLAVLVLR